MQARLAEASDRLHFHAHHFVDCPSWIRRRIWHILIYPKLDRKINAEADFFLSGHLPPIFPRHVPNIVTCHNLLPFDIAEMDRYTNRRDRAEFKWARRRQIKSYNTAAARIYPSQYSQTVIGSQLRRCFFETIIGHGVDRGFFLETQRSYAVGGSFKLLYVSDIHPYKNHKTVIEAVSAVRSATGIDIQLDLAGGGNATEIDRLRLFITKAGASAYVHLLGRQSDAELRSLYNSSDAFVFGSSIETFGIALLEAMAAALPIACSQRSGLPDLVGDAGVYFDPFDVPSAARAIATLCASESLRTTLAKRARERARTFDWERSATDTFDFIDRVIQKTGRTPQLGGRAAP
jgi:glycosyltransferase involved in cell wall biosynthesis